MITRLLTLILFITFAISANAQQEEEPDLNFSLLLAADSGNTERLIELIASGADVNTRCIQGFTPLMYACQKNHKQTVKALIGSGATIDDRSNWGMSPLMIACVNNLDTIAEILLENGADPDFRDYNHYTPLMLAASAGNYIPVDMLIYFGADVNAATTDSSTPLHGACLYGQSAIVALLCQKGANVDVKSTKGYTPLMAAVLSGNINTVATLFQFKPNPNVVNFYNESALTYAVIQKNPELAHLLVENGASTDSSIFGTYSPKRYATIFYDKHTYKAIQPEPKLSSYIPCVTKIGFSLAELSFNGHDNGYGGHLLVYDSRYKSELGLGYKTRLAANRRIISHPTSGLMQAWEKRSAWFAYVGKHFVVAPGNVQTALFVKADIMYTYGKYRAMEHKPTSGFIPSFFAGISIFGRNAGWKIGYKYMDVKVKELSPHQFETSLAFYINRFSGRHKIPYLSWFQ